MQTSVPDFHSYRMLLIYMSVWMASPVLWSGLSSLIPSSSMTFISVTCLLFTTVAAQLVPVPRTTPSPN